MNGGFFAALGALIDENGIRIDRPKGQAHPKYPDFIYLLDYGYIPNTSSMDGGGIDLFRGSLGNRKIAAVLCTIDMLKKDSEIKILYECSEDEIKTAFKMMNEHSMRAILIRAPG